MCAIAHRVQIADVPPSAGSDEERLPASIVLASANGYITSRGRWVSRSWGLQWQIVALTRPLLPQRPTPAVGPGKSALLVAAPVGKFSARAADTAFHLAGLGAEG